MLLDLWALRAPAPEEEPDVTIAALLRPLPEEQLRRIRQRHPVRATASGSIILVGHSRPVAVGVNGRGEVRLDGLAQPVGATGLLARGTVAVVGNTDRAERVEEELLLLAAWLETD